MQCIIQYGSEWLSFENPVEVLSARTQEEVCDCLEKIESSGLWAAGFIAYEAAGAFDDALKTHVPGRLPLLQFGLFDAPESVESPTSNEKYSLSEWTPSVTRGEYAEAIARVKEHIAAGDTYQVNYTFRLNAGFSGDPFAFFCDLIAAQEGLYGAFIETDDFTICSASPELFFELKAGTVTLRPMKGTMARGLSASDDQKNAEALKVSAKDRAENIMIVDMIRNDIGRIATTGSVETLRRFEVEKYPTVWQLTSTVQGNVKPRNIGGILRALFPCASITGAPKARTMELIATLERTGGGLPSPRGVYTGAIGFLSPTGDACFSVAIRTAVVRDGAAEYGVGGGIVWDSTTGSEYEEALSKAAILTKKMPRFQLLETMLFDKGEIFLLERHLKRLADSADYFDFKIDCEEIRDSLRRLPSLNSTAGRGEFPQKIRLLLNRDGSFDLRSEGIMPSCGPVRLVLAREPVDSQNLFLYHKTTNRTVYENAKAAADKNVDDVLLYNVRGEVTESCVANVVVELDGRKITPPVSCGLLAGTLRNSLLESGEIEEGVISLADLKRADSISLINSVRKRRAAILVPQTSASRPVR